MTSAGPHFDDLRAVFFNCTLKPSPQLSHTQGLIDRSVGVHHPAAGRRRMDRRGRARPSYLDPGSGGPDNDFTNRNTTFMTWNLLHMARMLKDAGGIPPTGISARAGTPAAGTTSTTPEYR
jgi:hypothetical protein